MHTSFKLGEPLEKFNIITKCGSDKITARKEFCKIAEACFTALTVLHSKQILHWDIHGDNILMQRGNENSYRAIFIDFEKSWVINEVNPKRGTGNVIYNYALYMMGYIDEELWRQIINYPPFSIPPQLMLPQGMGFSPEIFIGK